MKNTSQNHELCLSNRQIFLNLSKRACCNQLKCWYIVCRPVSAAIVDIESPILHGTSRCPLHCVGWNNRHYTAHTVGWWIWVTACACMQYHKERIGSMSCRTVFKKVRSKKFWGHFGGTKSGAGGQLRQSTVGQKYAMLATFWLIFFPVNLTSNGLLAKERKIF